MNAAFAMVLAFPLETAIAMAINSTPLTFVAAIVTPTQTTMAYVMMQTTVWAHRTPLASAMGEDQRCAATACCQCSSEAVRPSSSVRRTAARNGVASSAEKSSPAPPSDAAYLANACVAKSRRRRGVGRGLLKAVEALVLDMGGCDVWLHVRADDAAAYALYSGEGYDEVARERAFSLGGLFGGKKQSPRVLMRKSIRTDGSCNFML